MSRLFPEAQNHPKTEWRGASAQVRGNALVDLLELVDALPQGRPPADAPRLPEKVIGVHRALAAADVRHAIGGAIAGAYYGEPRATLDIDVNVFLPVDRWPDVKSVMAPLGIEVGVDEGTLCREHEARLPWDRNDVHLFFSTDALHEAMPSSVREAPFARATIPLVAPEHLIVRKAILDRPKDWLDIEAVLTATDPLDLEEIHTWVRRLAGPEDPRVTKLCEATRRLAS
jgi:hypothetical protein